MGWLDLPEAFGDWEAEYRAVTERCVLAARPDRGAVVLTGDRPAEMLNGLITNEVVSPGDRGCHALLLNAKGRVLTDLRVFPSTIGLLVDVPRSGLSNLLDTLKKYIPPLYARFEDLSDLIAQVGVYGPTAAKLAENALGPDLPGGHLGVVEIAGDDEPVLMVRTRRLAGDGVELLGTPETVERLAGRLGEGLEAHGGSRAGRRALEVARIEAGIPRYGEDMSEENLAQETGLLDTISFEKGCYLGQEVVARIHYRGHVNRHLRALAFGAEPLPEPGAELYTGEKRVGNVTSAATSPQFGGVGLGYVRHEIEPGSSLRWVDAAGSEGEALVREKPFRGPFVVGAVPG